MVESKIFEKAKVKLVLHHPFFATLALHLLEKKESGIPTTATDGRHLFVNEKWGSELKDEERVFVLGHEVLHLALGHLWRRGTKDPLLWNMACDYAVNEILIESGVGTMPKGGLYDPSFKGMTAEQIYEILKETAPKKGGLCVFLPGLGGDDEGEKVPLAGCEDIFGSMSPEEREKALSDLKEHWKGLLAEAYTAAKMRGKVPEGLERLVKEILQPKMRWDRILDLLVPEVIRDDYDLTYPDRRFLVEPGIYLPDLFSEKRYVAVAVDTSGSRDQEDLKISVGEAVGIIRSRGVSRVRIMAADAKITLDVMIEPQDEVPESFPGGGGTNFVPVFQALEESQEKPALLVYFTDGWGEFPKEPPNYPVLWIVNRGDAEKVPFGVGVQYETLKVVKK